MAEHVVDAVDGYAPEAVEEPAHARDPAKDPTVLEALQGFDQERQDAFVNELTGVGDFTRDKTMGGQHNGVLPVIVRFLTGAACRDRWRGTDLGARIVEQIPSEMTREGFELNVQPTDEDGFELRADVRHRADDIRRERGEVGVSGRAWSELQRAVRRTHTQQERSDAIRDWLTVYGDDVAPPVPAGRQMARSSTGPVTEEDDEDEGQAIVEALEARLRDLGAIDKVREAICYERAFGGGAILLGANDGAQGAYEDQHGLRLDAKDKRNITSPLDEKSIKSINHLTALRGGWDGEVIAWSYYDDIMSPRYGEPKIYMLRNIGVPIGSAPAPGQSSEEVRANYRVPNLTAVGGPTTYWVHESRLLVFPGIAPDHWARVQMRGWGDSVFMRIDEVLSQFGQTWNSIAILMQEFALGVLKIDGLAGMLAKKDPNSPTGATGAAGMAAIRGRALALQLAQSMARVRMLDKNEDFSRVTVPLTGLADVLEQFGLRMAAAADMPVSLLFGQSPGGLRAGDDDRMFFYDRVKSKQLTHLVPQWRRLLRLLLLAKDSPTGGVEPKRWSVVPKALWQPTAKEDAELRKTQADADAIYMQWGVVTPAEIAASRFGGAKYSTDTVIDLKARQQMADLEPEPGVEQGGGTAVPATPTAPGTGNPTDTPAPGKGGPDVQLTPSAESAIITVNEARAAKGLPPWPGADGHLTVAEFTAKRAPVVAAAANAEAGSVGKPPQADTPPPPAVAPPGHSGDPGIKPGGDKPSETTEETPKPPGEVGSIPGASGDRDVKPEK